MTIDTWKSLVRIGGFFAGAVVMGISLYFSADGFNIEVPNMLWLGYVLGCIIIYMELYVNHEGIGTNPNLTLIFVGLLAYLYGIWTNFLGIAHAMGIADPFSNPTRLPFPILLALILEILPEPLILYAMVGTHAEDLLSKLFGKGGNSAPHPAPAAFRPPAPSRPAMLDEDDEPQPPFRRPMPGGMPPEVAAKLMKNAVHGGNSHQPQQAFRPRR